MQNLNDKSVKSHVNPKFLEDVEGFKANLHAKLVPMKSVEEGEFVTGEGMIMK